MRGVIRLGMVIILLWAVPTVAFEGESIEVNVEREEGGRVADVSAQLVIPVDSHQAWEVLADYPHMSEFIPDIDETRLLSEKGTRSRVEIKGTANLLFMSFPVKVILDVEVVPGREIRFQSVGGNMAMSGTTTITQVGNGVEVDYQAELIPDFWVPPIIGPVVIGAQVKRQFEGLVREMKRRTGPSQVMNAIPLS